MGSCAVLKVGVLIIFFFSIVVLARSNMSTSGNEWMECWKHFSGPRVVDPTRYFYCCEDEHDHDVLRSYQITGNHMPMSVNERLECWRLFSGPSEVDPVRYFYCSIDERAVLLIYQITGKLPHNYKEALKVSFNGNQTEVDEYIRGLAPA